MTEENKILLTQNTSNILPNVKGKEEEIKSEHSKPLPIEHSIYKQNEREYTEQEIQNIIITNIIKIAVNVLKKDENNIEGIKKRTILRLNEIRAKENKVTQEYFNTILQSQEQVQKFENLSQVLQQFSREIDANYFNLQSSY